MKLKSISILLLTLTTTATNASDLLMSRFNEVEEPGSIEPVIESALRATEACEFTGAADLDKLKLQAECLLAKVEQNNGSDELCDKPSDSDQGKWSLYNTCLRQSLQSQIIANAKVKSGMGILFEPKIGVDENRLTPSISFSTVNDTSTDSTKSQFYFEFKANAQADVAEAEELANTIVINDANLHFELGYMFKYRGNKKNESVFSDWTLATSYTYGLATTNELSQNQTTLDVESEISSFQVKLMYSFKDVHIMYELDDYDAKGDVDNSEFLNLIDGKKSSKVKVSIPFTNENDNQRYYLTFTRSKLDDTSKPIFRAEISTSF